MTTMHADVPGDIDARVGKRVFLLMWERHLTQTAVAARLGIEQSALSRKLRGNRGWSIRELMVVAKVLDTSTAYLLGETEDSTQPDPDGGGARTSAGATPVIHEYLQFPVAELPRPDPWETAAQSIEWAASNLTQASLDRAA